MSYAIVGLACADRPSFGGLLATGLYQIGHRGGEAGWRWIIIIEGLMTAVIGLLAIVVLPSTVDKARFLTEEERRVASARLIADRPLGLDDHGNAILVREPFSWWRVGQAVFSIKTWLSALSYLTILTALYSFGLFVPTIVQGLGYTAVRAQLFTVPPYAVAAVLTVVAAYVSDRIPSRGPVILCFLPISIAGYAIIRTTTHNHVKYGALFLMAGGLYPSVPPLLVWLSNNYTNHYTRATAIALQLAIANCGELIFTLAHSAMLTLAVQVVSPQPSSTKRQKHRSTRKRTPSSWVCWLRVGFLQRRRSRTCGI